MQEERNVRIRSGKCKGGNCEISKGEISTQLNIDLNVDVDSMHVFKAA